MRHRSSRMLAAALAASVSLVGVPAMASAHSMGDSGPMGDNHKGNGESNNPEMLALRQAVKDAKAAVRAANMKGRAAFAAARAQFFADTATQRAALLAAFESAGSDQDARDAAKAQYLLDTADARAARRATMMAAYDTWKSEHKAAMDALDAAKSAFKDARMGQRSSK
jgi:hypothetical protein